MADEIAPPPPGGTTTDPASWVSEHKGAVIGGAIIIGALVFYLVKKSKGGTTNQSASVNQAGSGGYPAVYEVTPGSQQGGYGSDNNALQGANSLSALIQSYEQLVGAGLVPNPAGTGVQGAGGTSGVTSNNQGVSALNGSGFFNPYPVGTVVAPNGEAIVQSLPWASGYVDVTNMGGLYTTGAPPSGSAYSGQVGNYSAAISGNNIYEYTPTGVKEYTI